MQDVNKEEVTTDQPTWPFEREKRSRSSSFNQLDAYLKSLIRTIPDFPKPGLIYR